LSNIVTPGDFLCVEEEYIPSQGAYSDDGNVRAYVVGRPIIDRISRRVRVKPVKRLQILQAGDTVIGAVINVREDLAYVKILGTASGSLFKNPFSGLLHVSQISPTRISTIIDAVRIGDIIKAAVLNSTPPFILTTKDPNLGVILAFCSKCGATLVRDGNRLICPNCGNVEQRKLSIDYIASPVRGAKRG